MKKKCASISCTIYAYITYIPQNSKHLNTGNNVYKIIIKFYNFF